MQSTFGCSLDWCVSEEGWRDSCPKRGIGRLDQEWPQKLFSLLILKRYGLDRSEKSMHFLCNQKALSEVVITLQIPGKWLKLFSFTWGMRFGTVTVQLLGGRRTDQLLEMGSEIKATNVTSLQDPALGRASGWSLAGVVHPSDCSAGLLRWAQGGWKHPAEEKRKRLFGLDFQYEYRLWKRGLVILLTFWVLPKPPNIPNSYYVYACKL